MLEICNNTPAIKVQLKYKDSKTCILLMWFVFLAFTRIDNQRRWVVNFLYNNDHISVCIFLERVRNWGIRDWTTPTPPPFNQATL